VAENNNIDSKEFALEAARIATELNGKDVMIVDLRGISPATDFYVIATGTSNRQGRTIVDEISVFGKAHGYQRFGMAGYEQGQWILADFVDVVVHVFDDEYRDYYQLETLWGDAEEIDLPEFEKPHAPHAQPAPPEEE
jgi:ribosome-associated protein